MPDGSGSGQDVHCRYYGGGSRNAVFLHCALSHAGAWKQVALRLGDRLAVVAPDLPGHGHNPLWTAADGDFHARTTDMVEGLCDGPVDMVGHSVGATVMLRLALRRPDLCRTLTLVEPVYFAAANGTAEHARYARLIAPFRAALARGDTVGAARLFHESWGALPWSGLTDDQQAEIVMRIHMIEAAEPALSADVDNVLAPGRLEALAAPVSLVEGSTSPEIVGAIMRNLAGRLPNVRRALVQGAGHMAPITHPEPVAAAIEGNLSRG